MGESVRWGRGDGGDLCNDGLGREAAVGLERVLSRNPASVASPVEERSGGWRTCLRGFTNSSEDNQLWGANSTNGVPQNYPVVVNFDHGCPQPDQWGCKTVPKVGPTDTTLHSTALKDPVTPSPASRRYSTPATDQRYLKNALEYPATSAPGSSRGHPSATEEYASSNPRDYNKKHVTFHSQVHHYGSHYTADQYSNPVPGDNRTAGGMLRSKVHPYINNRDLCTNKENPNRVPVVHGVRSTKALAYRSRGEPYGGEELPTGVSEDDNTTHGVLGAKAHPYKSQIDYYAYEKSSTILAGGPSAMQQITTNPDACSYRIHRDPYAAEEKPSTAHSACYSGLDLSYSKEADYQSPENDHATPVDSPTSWDERVPYFDVSQPPRESAVAQEQSAHPDGSEWDMDSFIERVKSRIKTLMPTLDYHQLSRSRSQSPSSSASPRRSGHQSSRSSTSSHSTWSSSSGSSHSSQSSSSSTSSGSSDSGQSSSQQRVNRQSLYLSSSIQENSRQSECLPERTFWSHSPHRSRSRSPSSLTCCSQSPHLYGSHVKNASHSPCSAHSRSRSPLKRASRSPHSSQSRQNYSQKVNPLPNLSGTRNSFTPHERIRHLPYSSRSRSRSPRRRDSSSSRSTSSRSHSHSRRTSRPRSRSRPSSRKYRSSRSRTRTRYAPRRRSYSSRSRNLSPQWKGRYSRSPSPERLHHKEDAHPGNFGVKVQFHPLELDEKRIKENIFRLFGKFGFVTSVHICQTSSESYAVVFYNRPYEQQNAVFKSSSVLLNNKKCVVSLWTGASSKELLHRASVEKSVYCVGDGIMVVTERETETISRYAPVKWDDNMIQFHHRSSRTLLIDNLPKAVAPEKLDNICERFENILDIEVEDRPGKATCYAFVEFSDITSLIHAGKALDGEFFGTSNVQVDFAESKQTNCMWVDGLSPNVSWPSMTLHFSSYGPVAKKLYDRIFHRALILYRHRGDAVLAMQQIKLGQGKSFGTRLMVDFASDRCQLAFCQAMEASGQVIGNFLHE